MVFESEQQFKWDTFVLGCNLLLSVQDLPIGMADWSIGGIPAKVYNIFDTVMGISYTYAVITFYIL